MATLGKLQRYILRIRWNRKLLLLYTVGLIWIFLLLTGSFNMILQEGGTLSPEKEKELVRLSQLHIEQLAVDTKNMFDGPLASKRTGYDMKKTLAILLEDLMQRVNRLERESDKIFKNKSSIKSYYKHYNKAPVEFVNKSLANTESNVNLLLKQKKINANQLIMGVQDDCSMSSDSIILYPHCEGKMQWMKDHWQVDSCFSDYGVDGTECSFRAYLSEIESFCPLLPGRTRRVADKPLNNETKGFIAAKMNFNVQGLLGKLVNPGYRPNYDWIRQRVTLAWPSWVSAGKKLQNKYNTTAMATSKKKILIYLGFLTQKSHFKMAENSLKGGPLGELVQWTDVICSLYMLGHDVTIASEYEELSAVFLKLRLDKINHMCDTRENLPIDNIYTDLTGAKQLQMKLKNGYAKIRCLLRILDSFGTEPAFNYGTFARQNRKKTVWGMQDLDPQQIFTMFPHSPDNSFMGFVIEDHLRNLTGHENIPRKNQAVVYGKAEHMWMGKDSYLDLFHQVLDIHGTVYEKGQWGIDTIVPKYVHNHGVLPGEKLHALLRESKLFIGMGFPYEGPAPLEAIAQGNVFINAKFDPPHSSLNTKFFRGKPTTRELTSQHPYAEMFIGEPHVRTVDMDDKAAVKTVIKQALSDIDNGKVSGFIPYEFTHEGMLQRVSTYVQKQDFCSLHTTPWPPKEDVQFILSSPKQSCKDACWNKGLMCERSHFQYVNNRKSLEKYTDQKCAMTMHHEDIYFPAYREDSGQCVLQQHYLLYSCVGAGETLRRICPCRTYIKQQTALCQKCL